MMAKEVSVSSYEWKKSYLNGSIVIVSVLK